MDMPARNPKVRSGASRPPALRILPSGGAIHSYINTGCNIEDLGGAAGAGAGGFACTGNTSLVRQATVGFWDNIYKGPFGRLAGGLQYSFTQKYDFGGIGGSQERNENMFLTSLRYYPF